MTSEIGLSKKPFFSFIIPVYNRPEELRELLESMVHQTFKDFEVLVIEDGSTLDSKNILPLFDNKLAIKYFVKPNTGQGFSRNYGFERAKADFFIILDSDVLLPSNYLLNVFNAVEAQNLDAFGGPDAAHENFNKIQKAISYSMTSFLTTGGIRGNKNSIGGNFHPRSFNMGISRKIVESLGGFKITRLGEDIEYSLRIQAAGFKSALIPEAFVYHKRRSDFIQFWKQTHFFGRARINIFTFYPSSLKLVHFIPALFTLFIAFTFLCIPLEWNKLFNIGAAVILSITLGIIIESFIKYRNIHVALLSVTASFVQLIGYGIGFITDFFKRIVFKIN